jgi:protein TonB
MEQRLFQDLVDSDTRAHSASKGATFPISFGLHSIAVLAIIIVPILQPDLLPEPTSVVKAFFVEPAAAPAPPPPPPPPAPRAAPTRPVVQPPPTSSTFTAPIAVPQEIHREESLSDFGVEGGVAGGVEGGVPGGVVGGVVGGLPAAPPPTERAIRVGGNVKPPLKTFNIDPVYPDIAKQAHVQGVVILECTISPQGRVTNVKVLREIPLLNEAAMAAVRQWRYTPTLLNGVPVPVIMTVTVNFKLN